ncbi:MAG: hypothetical protein HRT57_00950 [Crocinitomicaceae bacterium]|nr:hypothetical protein [Crocinitomicaceae bacterium]
MRTIANVNTVSPQPVNDIGTVHNANNSTIPTTRPLDIDVLADAETNQPKPSAVLSLDDRNNNQADQERKDRVDKARAELERLEEAEKESAERSEQDRIVNNVQN